VHEKGEKRSKGPFDSLSNRNVCGNEKEEKKNVVGGRDGRRKRMKYTTKSCNTPSARQGKRGGVKGPAFLAFSSCG